MSYSNRTLAIIVVLGFATAFGTSTALAQRDAGSKIRGEYSFYGNSASRSMRGARETSQAYRQYVQAAPQQKVNQEVAKEAADAIGDYITKAQKHMAWMRKQAEADNDKETLTSLTSIDKNLVAAGKSHKDMHAMCLKDNVDAGGSMKCCQQVDESLAAAIAEHDKLMKRLASDKPAAK
jgi:excinuclease UvrABC helicase subunit UvrB